MNVFDTYADLTAASLARPLCFCVETNTFYAWNGTEWIAFPNTTAVQNTANAAVANVSVPVYSRVTTLNAVTVLSTLDNVAGLSNALSANSVYEFQAVLSVASSSNSGTSYGMNFSAAGASIEAQVTGTLAATTHKTMRFNAFNTAQGPFVTMAGNGGIIIKGIVTTGASGGNLVVQHSKVTAGISTVYINSFLKTTKI